MKTLSYISGKSEEIKIDPLKTLVKITDIY